VTELRASRRELEGTLPRLGFEEESSTIMRRRGGFVRLVIIAA
jgi:hypothetical protein